MSQISNNDQEQNKNQNYGMGGQIHQNTGYSQVPYQPGYYTAPDGNQNMYGKQPMMEGGYSQQPMGGYPPQTPIYHQQYSRPSAQYQPLLMQTGQPNYPPSQTVYPLQPQMQQPYNQNAPQGYPGEPAPQRVSPPTVQQQPYNQNVSQGYPGGPAPQGVSPSVMHQQQPHVATDIVNQKIHQMIDSNNVGATMESANKMADAYAAANSLKTPCENTMTPAHHTQTNVAQQPGYYQQPMYHPTQVPQDATQSSQRVSPPTVQQQPYNQNVPQGYPGGPAPQRVSPPITQPTPHFAADVTNQQIKPLIDSDNKSKIMDSANNIATNYAAANSIYTPCENATSAMPNNQEYRVSPPRAVQPSTGNLAMHSPMPQQGQNQSTPIASLKEEQPATLSANAYAEEDESNSSKTKLVEIIILVVLIAMLLALGAQVITSKKK